MTAKDYLTALKVIREIQRKQAYCSGQSKPYLAETLKEIEMYCPLDFSKTGGRVTEKVILSCYVLVRNSTYLCLEASTSSILQRCSCAATRH